MWCDFFCFFFCFCFVFVLFRVVFVLFFVWLGWLDNIGRVSGVGFVPVTGPLQRRQFQSAALQQIEISR